METPAAEVQALAAYQSGDLVPASDSSEATLQLLEKDGPHHVLLAPSVFAEVTQMKLTYPESIGPFLGKATRPSSQTFKSMKIKSKPL